MPAKSKAQFRKIAMLYKQGKVSKKTLDDFDKGVSFKKLPAKKNKGRWNMNGDAGKLTTFGGKNK